MNVFRSLQGFVNGFWRLPVPQRMLYAGMLAVLLGTLAYVGYMVNKPDFTPLYSGLASDDLGRVVESLKVKQIPYQLSGNNGIAVPKDQLYEVRLALATEGIPRGAGVGFELFDQQKLGSTQFVQKVNYQRALQGELAHTINQLDEVAESRVHLVIPEESLFVEEQQPASAAVVLKLRSGSRLSQRQIQGIVNLVAGTVQGLKQEGVTILSTDGQVLYKENAGESSFQLSNFQLEYKNRLEEALRMKVQSMLQEVLGANKVITRVTTDLDFNRKQVNEDLYDPDSAVVRSQQRSIESSQGRSTKARGNPDVPINVDSQLLQDSPPGQSPSKELQRQRETVNYELSRTQRQTIHTPGTLLKLSVAVILDGPYEVKQDANGNTVRTFVGRNPKEMKAFEELVKKAVGYDEGRGDQISISNIPFATDSTSLGMGEEPNKYLELLKQYQKIILNVFLVALAFFLVVRPLMRRLQQLADNAETMVGSTKALPPGEHDEIGLLGRPPLDQGVSARQRASTLVQNDPHRAAEIVRAWLREEES